MTITSCVGYGQERNDAGGLTQGITADKAGGKEDTSISPLLRQYYSYTAAPCLYHKKRHEGMSAKP